MVYHVTVKEHSITKLRELLEVKKVVKSSKGKARGPWDPELKHILAAVQAKAKTGRVKPGRHYFRGTYLHVDSSGHTLLQCPHCGQMWDNYVDYEEHVAQEHPGKAPTG